MRQITNFKQSVLSMLTIRWSKQSWVLPPLVLLGALLLLSCGTSRPYYENKHDRKTSEDYSDNREVDYQIFLIGDAGLPNLKEKDKTLAAFTAQLQQGGANSSAVFLGDNIYENGMPAVQNGKERRLAEEKITKSLETLVGYSGGAYFIPGNHDWRISKERLLAQEAFIVQFPDVRAELIPDHGCPGPVAVNLSEDWLLIAPDSEWWINQSLKAEVSTDGCKRQTHETVMTEIENIVSDNTQKKILIAVHHPLHSNGSHGGNFT